METREVPIFADKRRVRDSNPRYPKGYTGFRVQRDRSLCQLSWIAGAKLQQISEMTKIIHNFLLKKLQLEHQAVVIGGAIIEPVAQCSGVLIAHRQEQIDSLFVGDADNGVELMDEEHL